MIFTITEFDIMSGFSTGLEPGISGVKRTSSGAVKKAPVDSIGMY